MALIEMRAEFKCDGCGRAFSVEVDSAPAIPEGWSAFDVAEDAVRGSVAYRGPKDANGTTGSSSVQEGRHLCGPCTSVADASEEGGN
jgi:hypothetical protein